MLCHRDISFFSYSCRSEGREAQGNIWLDCNKFPPNAIIRKEAAKKSGFAEGEIVVTGMFEFKDEDDFHSFNATDCQRS